MDPGDWPFSYISYTSNTLSVVQYRGEATCLISDSQCKNCMHMPHIHFCGARVFFYCAGGSLWLYLKFSAIDFDKRESFLISLKDETERRREATVEG